MKTKAKKQLLTTVRTPRAYFKNGLPYMVVGEVFYMRRTLILKRLVREVIYKIEIPLDYLSFQDAKRAAQKCVDEYAYQYYAQ